jgi:hypothetical protein
MVAAPGEQPAPLISNDVHRAMCGFNTTVAHPWNDSLGRCAGCRCWLVVAPPRRRPCGVA